MEKDTANSIIKSLQCVFKADKEVKRKIESLKKAIESINSAEFPLGGIGKLKKTIRRTEQRIRAARNCKNETFNAILEAESKEE